MVTLQYILPREDLRLGNMGVEKNLVGGGVCVLGHVHV